MKKKTNYTTLNRVQFNTLAAQFETLARLEVAMAFNYVENLKDSGQLEGMSIGEIGRYLRAHVVTRSTKDPLLMNKFARAALALLNVDIVSLV